MTRPIVVIGEVGRGDLEVAGGKGANLGELVAAGLPVPGGFVITTEAYREYVATAGIADEILRRAADPEASDQVRALFDHPVPDALAAAIGTAYDALGSDAAVAVRSSATAEDLAEASFAGQQDTFLNVVGRAAVLAAVRDCWASLWTPRAIEYRRRQGIEGSTVSLAVVVQRMVEADAAGVMFTANPANGRRDEIVIAAAWGLGESVVGGTVNTDDLVVRRADGEVLARRTADKTVMTRYAATGTAEVEVPAQLRRAEVLTDAQAARLAAYGRTIEEHFGAPQDIEWALAGEEFWIVQARPITALALPEAPLPTDWTVDEPTAMYARASIVEQLPDPLTPLFGELIDGSVARSLKKLMNELTGVRVVRDGDVGLPTVNGYAYYRYSRSGLIRVSLLTPLAMRLIMTDGDHSSLARWRDHSHPLYQRQVASWLDRPLDQLSVSELLAGVGELLDAGTEYYTSVQTIIPVAAYGEIIFSSFYDRLVRRAGDPPAAVLLLGEDSEPIRAEKSLFELARWAGEHPPLADALRRRPAAEILDPRTGAGDPVWEEWRQRFGQHLARFGHAVYNLDFANAVPADAPAPLLDTVRFYLNGGGTDPAVRQAGSVRRREDEAARIAARLDPLRRAAFERLRRRALAVIPAREDALADVGLAWPQLRRMLAELGSRLVAAGAVDRVEDVFWLHRAEILHPPADARQLIEQRRQLWRGRRRATPPQLLPRGAWFEWMSSMMPAASEEQTGAVISGLGGSPGQVTGPARVLAGPEEFSLMQPGEVLVASITTPAWTSLFAMASAVVTDVGGPLSHSSIVAREYGIPAVLGTAVATRRITSGQQIKVDGDAGTVTLLDEVSGEPEPSADAPTSRRRTAALVGAGVAASVGAVLIARRLARR